MNVRGDRARRVDFLDAAVTPICHVDVSGSIQCNAVEQPKFTGLSNPIVCSRFCYRAHDSGRRDFTNGRVEGIHDVKIANAVDRQLAGVTKLRYRSSTISITRDRSALPGKGSNGTAGRDLLDGI